MTRPAAGASGTATTLAASNPHSMSNSSRTTDASHSTRAARCASHRGRAAACHSRSYRVKSAAAPPKTGRGPSARTGSRRHPSGAGAGAENHIDVPNQPVEPRPAGRRTPASTAVGAGPERTPARHHRPPARQQQAVLDLRELRGQGFEQGRRIVRHPACPAADQAAPVDSDPHACCPVTVSPSTRAPPRVRSSAAWSAGRASSRRGCPRCDPTRYACSRRGRGSCTAPATPGSRACSPSRAARRRAAVPGQSCAARVPAQRRRDPRRRGAAPSRVVLARLRGLAAAAAAGPGPSRAARRDRIRVLARRARRAAGPGAPSASPWSPVGSRGASPPAADPGRRAPTRLEAPLRPVRRLADRAQEPAALVPAARRLATTVEVVVAGGHRPQFAREPGLGRAAAPRPVPDDLLPGLYAGAEAFVLPRLSRASACPARGDGVRDAGRRRRRSRAARDCRRCRAPRAARGRASRARWAACSPTPPSAAPAAPPASSAPRVTWDRRRASGRCGAHRARRAAPRGLNTSQRRHADDLVAAEKAAQPRPVERIAGRPFPRDPRVPDDFLDPELLARTWNEPRERGAQPGSSPRSSMKPAASPLTLPREEAHEISVSQIGTAGRRGSGESPSARARSEPRSGRPGVRVYGWSATASKGTAPPCAVDLTQRDPS